ncbi:MAG: 2-succinyl-5-enolpyruvyl-6-hydroxy-3-cyclohexene-1-carboxylate synthase, partial [Bacteroidota bacterium]
FFCLSHHFEISINTFFKGFLDRIQTNNHDYYERWCVVRERYKRKRMEYVKTIPFSDMWVFHTLSKRIPNGYQLHLANSSTVRYTQLFDFNASIRVFCNRGTSGIDGSTSTALGASYYGKVPTLFVTGDLSFFYDSNGLWNPYIRADFRMILINNQGGGIFRILPGDSNGQNFETFFETTHAFDASDLCGMYAIDYTLVDDKQGLEDALSTFFTESDGPKLLEIKTPRLLNDKILLSYFDFIS